MCALLKGLQPYSCYHLEASLPSSPWGMSEIPLQLHLTHGAQVLHSGGILAQCVRGSQGQTQAAVLGRPSQLLLLSLMAQGTNTLQGTGGYREGLSPFCPQLAKSALAQRLQAEPGSGEMSANVSADVVLARGDFGVSELLCVLRDPQVDTCNSLFAYHKQASC